VSPAWTTSSHGIDWRLELERDALLPGRLVPGRIDVTSRGTFDARALVVALRAEEHWKHEVTTTDAEGRTETHVETERRELVREPVEVASAVHLGAGEHRGWTFQLPVPPLGPASLEADVAGLDWTVVAKLDRPGGFDSSIEGAVRVLQPVALLRSGAVPVGEFALYDSADVAADGISGSIAIDPVPLCTGAPFSATVTLRAGGSRRLQDIRAELRVKVKATVPSGLDEMVTAWVGSLPVTELGGERSLSFSGTLSGQALPTIELPHAQASATFHVILATAWSRDPHLVRDVAVATTLEL
jgi:Arrestin (or S-antigen), N-terminal domain